MISLLPRLWEQTAASTAPRMSQSSSAPDLTPVITLPACRQILSADSCCRWPGGSISISSAAYSTLGRDPSQTQRPVTVTAGIVLIQNTFDWFYAVFSLIHFLFIKTTANKTTALLSRVFAETEQQNIFIAKKNVDTRDGFQMHQ